MIETGFDYTDDKIGWFFSNERAKINKVHALKEKYPDAVTILHEPEENDGFIQCKFPASWLKIAPKKEMHLTDEERARRAERLRKAQENRGSEE